MYMFTLFGTRPYGRTILMIFAFAGVLHSDEKQNTTPNSATTGNPKTASSVGQHPVEEFTRDFASRVAKIASEFGVDTGKKVLIGLACGDPVTCIKAISAIKGPAMDEAREKGNLRDFLLREIEGSLETLRDVMKDGKPGLGPGYVEVIDVIKAGVDAFFDTKENVDAWVQKAERAAADGRRSQIDAEAKTPKKTKKRGKVKPPPPPPPPTGDVSGLTELDRAILELDRADREHASEFASTRVGYDHPERLSPESFQAWLTNQEVMRRQMNAIRRARQERERLVAERRRLKSQAAGIDKEIEWAKALSTGLGEQQYERFRSEVPDVSGLLEEGWYYSTDGGETWRLKSSSGIMNLLTDPAFWGLLSRVAASFDRPVGTPSPRATQPPTSAGGVCGPGMRANPDAQRSLALDMRNAQSGRLPGYADAMLVNKGPNGGYIPMCVATGK